MVALRRAPEGPQSGLEPPAPGECGPGETAADLRLPRQHSRTQPADRPGAAPVRRQPAAGVAGGCVLDRAAPAGPRSLRAVALETAAAQPDALTPPVEHPAVRGRELGVRAGEPLALAGSPGPGPQRRPQPLLGLVVAADPAHLSPGGTAVVFLLPVHGVGGDRPAAGATAGLATAALAPRRQRPLGGPPARRRFRSDPPLGSGGQPREHRLAEQLPAVADHRRRRGGVAGF